MNTDADFPSSSQRETGISKTISSARKEVETK